MIFIGLGSRRSDFTQYFYYICVIELALALATMPQAYACKERIICLFNLTSMVIKAIFILIFVTVVVAAAAAAATPSSPPSSSSSSFDTTKLITIVRI